MKNVELARIVGLYILCVSVIYTLGNVHTGVDIAFTVADEEATVGVGFVAAPTVLANPSLAIVVVADNTHGMPPIGLATHMLIDLILCRVEEEVKVFIDRKVSHERSLLHEHSLHRLLVRRAVIASDLEDSRPPVGNGGCLIDGFVWILIFHTEAFVHRGSQCSRQPPASTWVADIALTACREEEAGLGQVQRLFGAVASAFDTVVSSVAAATAKAAQEPQDP